MLALLALEVGLRLGGYGYETGFFLTRKSGSGPAVLTTNPQFGWRFFPQDIARTPRPLALPARKPEKTCRIFIFGESAAYGDPAPAFGLPRVLEALLRDRYPGTRFEVINAAMTAINSNVILPIADDCARQEGDFWVLYIGNNEVVGPFGGGTVFGPQVPGLPLIRSSIALKATRTGQLLGDGLAWLGRAQATNPAATVSMELFLDQQLRADDPRMARVYAHFARNLADIIKTGTRSGAKVLVSTMAVNLKDCPPFGALNRLDLDAGQKAAWEKYYQAGIQAEAASDWAAALAAYQKAGDLDDSHAELQFRMARACWQSGQFEAARHHFERARDFDPLRFRADRQINQIIRAVATNRLAAGVALVDGELALARQSPHQVIGGELFYEHVHLNFKGNYWLARALAGQIEPMIPAALTGPPARDWLSEADCARQLDLNDWDRHETSNLLCRRMERPPFTRQLDHEQQFERLKRETDQLRSRLTPAALTAAIADSRKAVVRRPEDWVLQQKLGQLLSQGSDQAGAVEAFRKVASLLPEYPEAHYELGEQLLRLGQPVEAMSELQAALRHRRHYPQALHALGRVFAAQQQWLEAIAQYEAAIRLKADFPEALVDLGKALDQAGRPEEAKARFAAALRLNPGDLEAGLALGQLRDQSGTLSETVRRYSDVLQKNPADAVAHYQLGRSYRQLGRPAEAHSHYAEAVRLRPEFAEAHCQLGYELALQGNSSAAMTHFAEAIRLKPDLAVAHLNLGVALARQKKYPEAAASFTAALRLSPTNAEAQAYLKEIRKVQGQ